MTYSKRAMARRGRPLMGFPDFWSATTPAGDWLVSGYGRAIVLMRQTGSLRRLMALAQFIQHARMAGPPRLPSVSLTVERGR